MDLDREIAGSWRKAFEKVRSVIGNVRDEDGVVGSINWLRRHMEKRNANPNVVRNIIYRDKGKLKDKQILFDIFKNLYRSYSSEPLQIPELEALFSVSNSTENEILQLLGREKRKTYNYFVTGVINNESPKLLITGKPGSGKTLLTDYIQQALELPPRAADKILRLEFNEHNFISSLVTLALYLGISREVIEAKLYKIGYASAFSVQADAQSDVARIILDTLRHSSETIVLLFHLSQSLYDLHEISSTPLRLNNEEVSRVNAAEWLWLSLLEPASRIENMSILITVVNEFKSSKASLFQGPVKLTPPSITESRRFVRARLPNLSSHQQEAIVQSSGRSYEELRTLTLLAEIKSPDEDMKAENEGIEQLSQMMFKSGDMRLRDFLSALAIVSLPESPSFSQDAIFAMRDQRWRNLTSLEKAFLDPLPGSNEAYRSFSRRLVKKLRDKLKTQFARYRMLNQSAANYYKEEAEQDPLNETASRYLNHLFEARDWQGLEAWMQKNSVSQSLLHRLWQSASNELEGQILEAIILQIAAHYVRLGSYDHPDALRTFAMLEQSRDKDTRAWVILKRAEGALIKGQIEQSDSYLEDWPETQSHLLNAEYELLKANIARWHGDLDLAAKLVDEGVRPKLKDIPQDNNAERLLHAKFAIWAGLINKDQGKLKLALEDFSSMHLGDALIDARMSFQIGNVKMQLGQLKEAYEAFDEAVRYAQHSGAPIQEQARYLARRGLSQLKRSNLEQAKQDFKAAFDLLHNNSEDLNDLERDFWLAKIGDEYALLLLAKSEFEEAIFLLRKNQETFSNYQKAQEVNASFRICRSLLQLAFAYALKGSAKPYRAPQLRIFEESCDSIDTIHAQKLIGKVINGIKDNLEHNQSVKSLYREALNLASWLAREPKKALGFANDSLAIAELDYDRSESYIYSAIASMRAADYDLALDNLNNAEELLNNAFNNKQGDLGLFAWLKSAQIRTLLRAQKFDKALEILMTCLKVVDLSSFNKVLIRTFAEGLEENYPSEIRQNEQLAKIFGDLNDETLRLSDLMVISYGKEIK
ncbi:MAG TPA: hypothetical protein ENK21_07110 [Trueperaceae bacterium]|nr:hypothetical protein [Trueperaceae bacterium]